jgi:hypothetical protein
LAKLSLLQQLITERDEIDAAIRVIQRVSGGAVESGAKARAAMAWRLARGARNGTAEAAEAPARRGVGRPKKDALINRTGREVEALPVPPELREAIGNLDFREAVALAVRAVGVAIPTPELVLLLQNAGVRFPEASKRVPIARYVGQVAGTLARVKRLKKTANGWMRGTRV